MLGSDFQTFISAISDFRFCNHLERMDTTTSHTDDVTNYSSTVTMAITSSALSNDKERYHAAADILLLVAPPLILVIGTIGNILILVVLSRRSLRTSCCSVFLRVLAVADTIVLYSGLWPYIMRHILDDQTLLSSDAYCKGRAFTFYLASHFAVWILVAVAIERLIGVCSPMKLHTMCSPTIVGSTVVVMLITLTMLDTLLLFMVKSERRVDPDDNHVDYYCDSTQEPFFHFARAVWPWIDFAVYSAVPFVIMFVSNLCIIYKLCQSAAQRRISCVGPPIDTSGLTAMLVTVCVTFLILTAPLTTYIIVESRFTIVPGTDFEAKMLFAHSVTRMLAFINHAVNFFLYCLCAAEFRRNLRELFRMPHCCPCRKSRGGGIILESMNKTRSSHLDYIHHWPLLELTERI